MAFAQATDRHGSASAQAVDIDGFGGVMRTSGVEPALSADPWAENKLVAANERQSATAHDF